MSKKYIIDKVSLTVRSGSGGAGGVSFSESKSAYKSSPDGGNGGQGGSVYAQGNRTLYDLSALKGTSLISAENGKRGGSRNMYGRKGNDLIISLPLGTQILLPDHDQIIDLLTEEKILLLEGGKGGVGNALLRSSTNQSPRNVIAYQDYIEKYICFRLKLVSDIALIGLPNSGKSTILSHLSRSKTPIAPYPFSTRKPYIGTFYDMRYNQCTVIDLPPLVKGSNQGKGMGFRFLMHAERCSTLCFVLDLSQKNILAQYCTLISELELYGKSMTQEKKRFIVLTKNDLIQDTCRRQEIEDILPFISDTHFSYGKKNYNTIEAIKNFCVRIKE